jgi:hypothetical protein
MCGFSPIFLPPSSTASRRDAAGFPAGLHAPKIGRRSGSPRLPTLIRFVLVLGGLAALAYGGLFALANFVKVTPHEISETVELPKAQP